MVDDLIQALAPHHPTDSPYELLPMAIRQYYSEREYMCLTDAQKNTLIQNETEPDPE
jgi:hypothetical protein